VVVVMVVMADGGSGGGGPAVVAPTVAVAALLLCEFAMAMAVAACASARAHGAAMRGVHALDSSHSISSSSIFPPLSHFPRNAAHLPPRVGCALALVCAFFFSFFPKKFLDFRFFGFPTLHTATSAHALWPANEWAAIATGGSCSFCLFSTVNGNQMTCSGTAK
jgi:hypothetical protein